MFRRTRADDLGMRIVYDFEWATGADEKGESRQHFIGALRQSTATVVPPAPTGARQAEKTGVASPTQTVTITRESVRANLLPSVTATVKKVVQTLRKTFGPCGRAMPLSFPTGPLTATHGWEVLTNLASDDPSEQAVIRLMREAMKTRRSVGDGATRTALIAGEIFLETVPALIAGHDSACIQRGIERAAKAVAKHLEKTSSKLPPTNKMVKDLAMVASGGDAGIGDAMADALEKVGWDGLVYAKEGVGLNMHLDVYEGTQFDRGYLSPHFVTDPDEMQCVLENAYILIHEKKLSSAKDLVPLLEAVVDADRPMLIVANDVDGEVLETLVANKNRGTLKCCAVSPPGDGGQCKAILQDLAILTGGTAIFESSDRKLDDFTLADLGRASKIIIGKDNTAIIGGAGDHAEIRKRIEELRHEIETADSDCDREKFEERLAKLCGGAAVIDVGGADEHEIKTKTILVRDTRRAILAACENGVLPGGGVPLVRTAALLVTARSKPEEAPGIQAVAKALRIPLRTIVENAGIDPESVLEKVCSNGGFFGFDVVSKKLMDLQKAGIIDPTRVVIASVSNAAAIACRLIDHASHFHSAKL
jgi:chaperonin GroEL